MKKALFFALGWFCLVMAYIGVVTPGIPFSIFLVGAAYCFARSSKKMEAWIYNHKHFGPFLTNWENKSVFPQKGKYAMIAVMSTSLVFMYFTIPLNGVIFSGVFMLLVADGRGGFPAA